MRVDWLELGYLALLCGIAAAAWLALALAELGAFLGPAAAVAVLACGAAAAIGIVRLVRRRAAVAGVGWPPTAAAAGLLLVGVVVLGRPHEYLLTGLDPGTYADTGISIVRTGGIVLHDADVAALSRASRAALFRETPAAFVQGSRFVGFYLADGATGRVVPQGMHLLPAAMAVGYALGGVPGLIFVPPVLALVGIGGIGLLARRWGGDLAGGLAALLMLVNPAEAWFGRYPAAELWVQVGFFGGLVAFCLALAVESSALAFVAGALVGLSHLAKIDNFLVPVAVFALAAYWWLAGRLGRRLVAFVGGYALLVVHALLHAAFISTQYVYAVYAGSLPRPTTLAAFAGLAVLGATAVLVAKATGRGPVLVAALERRSGRLWLVAVGLVGLAGLYGWYARPMDPWHELIGLSDGFALVARNRLEGLPRLGWFVPPLAVLLAFTGYCLALRRPLGPAAALLLLLLPFEAALVFADPRITPTYPWAARRWASLIIPSVVLLASLQLTWLAGRLPSFRVLLAGRVPTRAFLAGGAAAALVLASLAATWPLFRRAEFVGSAALVQSISAAVEPGAVVLFDDDLVGWRLAGPLELLGGRTSFDLFGGAADDEALRQPLAEWQGQGRPVYWLRQGDAPVFAHWGRAWQPSGHWQTGLSEVASTLESPPVALAPFDVPITLYRASGP